MALGEALMLSAAGFPVVPVCGKTPRAKNWVDVVWTPERIREEFSRGADGVGLILRDGLLDFDCDGPEADPVYTSFELPDTVSWQSARGKHYIFQLTPAQLDQLRTRGKRRFPDLDIRFSPGQQSVLPPSGGRTWIRSLADAEPASLPSIDFLLAPEPEHSQPSQNGSLGAVRPGDVFNDRAPWEEILLPAGCRKVGTRQIDGRTVHDWLRPGETAQKLSMTTGYCQSTEEDDKLYVFTTNFPPFEENTAYSKFEAFSLLFHGGDRHDATRALVDAGYEATIDADVFDDDELLPAELVTVTAQEPTFDTDLLVFPGMVEAVQKWHLRRAQTIDPVMGAIAGIMLTSWMIGQRVKLFDDTRANLFAMVTGHAGSGKSEARDTIYTALTDSGFAESVARDVVSGPALEEVLGEAPNLIIMRDEVQDLMLHAHQSSFTLSLLSRLKEVFSASRGTFRPREKATEKRKAIIHQPNVSVLFLGTPLVLQHISDHFYEDGFMARMLLIEVDELAPRNLDVRDRAVPDYISEMLTEWREIGADPFDDDSDDGDAEEVREVKPHPILAPCTDGARQRLIELGADWQTYGDAQSVAGILYRRGQELACKLCMVGAMSESREREIDESLVDRVVLLVDGLIRLKLRHWQQRRFGDIQFQSDLKRVMSVVKELCGSAADGVVSWRQCYKRLHISLEEWKRFAFELVARGEVRTDAKITQDGCRFATPGKKIWMA